MLSVPPWLTFTTARLGTTEPGTKFRFEAVGIGWPAGHAVSHPPALGATAVMFTTTPLTPDVGTPPAPPMVTSSALPGPSGALPLGPERVSSTRDGVMGWKRLCGSPTAPYQPTTSTITCVEPELLNRRTLPSAPTFTVARLATVAPGVRL